jgi:hypothetical protein
VAVGESLAQHGQYRALVVFTGLGKRQRTHAGASLI